MVKCVCVGNKHNQFNNEEYKVKENKIMGLSCKKQTGKFKSIMRKMNNQLLAEKQAAKTKKKESKNGGKR